MANKAWSLRYFNAKLRLGFEEALSSLGSSASANMPTAVEKGLAAFNKQLTTVIYLTGAAMAPTLNATRAAPATGSSTGDTTSSSSGRGASATSASVEKLLMRWIPRPSVGNLFVGDVVAFNSPLSPPAPDPKNVLVRRIAAVEGAELVTDDPETVPVTIPTGHCWVLADNEALEAQEVIDSRSFGPLPLPNVLGRILYYYRSRTDCGEVHNSEQAQAQDEPVLRAELDLDTLGRQ